jgi:hypothetical protein
VLVNDVLELTFPAVVGFFVAVGLVLVVGVHITVRRGYGGCSIFYCGHYI